MSHKTVLELGAGTGLPSLLCALSGATSVVVTDHPDSPSLTTGAIASTMASNLSSETEASKARIAIRGHAWGSKIMYSNTSYGTPLPGSADERFDRLIICDCLWLASQHENLASSTAHYLSSSAESCAIVIAGFHTGRGVVRDFFASAAGEDTGGPLAISELYEVDVDGARRAWVAERAGETKEEAKRWCVVGVLRRRVQG